MDMRERIKAVLEEKGLSVRRASMAAGMSDSMLHKFLNGGTDSMTVKNAEGLAAALDVDSAWLMTGRGEPERYTDVAEKFGKLSRKHQDLVNELMDQLRTGTNG